MDAREGLEGVYACWWPVDEDCDVGGSAPLANFRGMHYNEYNASFTFPIFHVIVTTALPLIPGTPRANQDNSPHKPKANLPRATKLLGAIIISLVSSSIYLDLPCINNSSLVFLPISLAP